MFLDELRSIHPYTDIMLMMDNLKLHKSNDIKTRMNDLGFLYSYTPIYSPQYNGVEEVISMAKRLIKNSRLDLILTGQKEDLNKMILGHFNNLEPHYVAKCVARSLKLLQIE